MTKIEKIFGINHGLDLQNLKTFLYQHMLKKLIFLEFVES